MGFLPLDEHKTNSLTTSDVLRLLRNYAIEPVDQKVHLISLIWSQGDVFSHTLHSACKFAEDEGLRLPTGFYPPFDHSSLMPPTQIGGCDCLLSFLRQQLHPRHLPKMRTRLPSAFPLSTASPPPFPHAEGAKGEGRGLCLPFLVSYKIAPSIGMNLTLDPALAPSGATMSLPNNSHHIAPTDFRPSTLGSNASPLLFAGDELSLDHNGSPYSQSFTQLAPYSWASSTSPFPDSNASVLGTPHQDLSVSPYYLTGGGDLWVGVTTSATQFTIPKSYV
jgi:hypothetical protein